MFFFPKNFVHFGYFVCKRRKQVLYFNIKMSGKRVSKNIISGDFLRDIGKFFKKKST